MFRFGNLVAIVIASLCCLAGAWTSTPAWGQDAASATVAAGSAVSANYRLAPGDQLHITVFQNQELTVDTRVSEDGSVSFPLIGSIDVAGLDVGSAQRKLASALTKGGFLKNPQVNIQVTEIRGNTIAVLGQVNRAGVFPLITTTHVSQALAAAGGVAPGGADAVLLTGVRDGRPIRQEIDIAGMYQENSPDLDVVLMAGDSIFVPRAPTFYIYGEVIKPGNYRLERAMTMRQAIAAGGGLTLRGTERRLKVVRGGEKISIALDDPVLPGDVVYVAESFF